MTLEMRDAEQNPVLTEEYSLDDEFLVKRLVTPGAESVLRRQLVESFRRQASARLRGAEPGQRIARRRRCHQGAGAAGQSIRDR